MEFSKIVRDAEIVYRKDVDDGKAQFELLFHGGSLRFYARRDFPVGEGLAVRVGARMWAPGKFAMSVDLVEGDGTPQG